LDIVLLRCRGHPNVQAYHETTLELEESNVLTVRGDCIICTSCSNTDKARRLAARKGIARALLVAVNPFIEPYIASAEVNGFLPGREPRRLIIRRSSYVGDSLVVCSDRSASQLPAEMRKLLQSSYTMCYALLVASILSDDIDSIYELAGCIIEDTLSPSSAGNQG